MELQKLHCRLQVLLLSLASLQSWIFGIVILYRLFHDAHRFSQNQTLFRDVPVRGCLVKDASFPATASYVDLAFLDSKSSSCFFACSILRSSLCRNCGVPINFISNISLAIHNLLSSLQKKFTPKWC